VELTQASPGRKLGGPSDVGSRPEVSALLDFLGCL